MQNKKTKAYIDSFPRNGNGNILFLLSNNKNKFILPLQMNYGLPITSKIAVDMIQRDSVRIVYIEATPLLSWVNSFNLIQMLDLFITVYSCATLEKIKKYRVVEQSHIWMADDGTSQSKWRLATEPEPQQIIYVMTHGVRKIISPPRKEFIAAIRLQLNEER